MRVLVVVMLVAVRALAAGATSCAGSSFMPHCGQRPGSSLITSGCIGQA